MANSAIELLKLLDAEPKHRKVYRAAKLPFTALATLGARVFSAAADDIVGNVMRSLGYAAVFVFLGYMFEVIGSTEVVKTMLYLSGAFFAFSILRKVLK
ncbi:hypothetical protein [Comamonas thiooxydans]|uniref:hypothetical protein n=1 Tax=Comamonas thiooxydans TaxID=363952 RepID=UPI000B40792F|nr:hypothetical protein [Comamonas thiooxydans]